MSPSERRIRETYLVFGEPVLEQEEIDEVLATLKSGWIGTGPKVERFELDFAAYKGVPSAVAVSSASAGLHLACLALGLGQGDEVITTALTFCATVNAIIHVGAKPVLAHVDPATLNISPGDIERRITPKTRAILVVHFAGRMCDMDRIMDIARRHNLAVIEDCAHAIEAEYKGRKAGTFGDFGVFSFYSTKNVVTGEGGMVISPHSALLERIRKLALHGMSRDAWSRFCSRGAQHYYVEEAGFKYNITDIQASLGIHQLRRVEKNWARRHEIWAQYMRGLEGLPIGLPAPVEPETRHAYHLFQIRVDKARCGLSRDAFMDALDRRRIGTGVHYRAIPAHPYYQRKFGWRPEDYSEAYQIGEQIVSLPLSPKMTREDADYVVWAVRDVLQR